MPDRNGARRQSVTVDGEAKRGARLVHPAIPASNGSAVIVKTRELPSQLVVERVRQLRHPVLLHQRKHSGSDRGDPRVQSQHHPRLPLHLLLAVGVDQQRQCYPVGPSRSLDDIGEIALVLCLVEVLELLAGVLLVSAEIEISSVVYAFDFLPAEGKTILDIESCPGVVGQLAARMLMPLELGRVKSKRAVPSHAPFPPPLKPLGISPGLHEELHFHLLELTGSEDEIPRRDLVPECLSDLRNAEWDSLP